jgi:hypothetical protein
VRPALGEHLRHALELAADERLEPAPICEPRLRERTVSPKTSPSTSSIR